MTDLPTLDTIDLDSIDVGTPRTVSAGRGTNLQKTPRSVRDAISALNRAMQVVSRCLSNETTVTRPETDDDFAEIVRVMGASWTHHAILAIFHASKWVENGYSNMPRHDPKPVTHKPSLNNAKEMMTGLRDALSALNQDDA